MVFFKEWQPKNHQEISNKVLLSEQSDHACWKLAQPITKFTCLKSTKFKCLKITDERICGSVCLKISCGKLLIEK